MRPNYWVDVCARHAVRSGEVGSPRYIRNGIFTALHDIFHANPGRYAVAVPGELHGAGVRVFMSTEADAQELTQKLLHNRFILGNAQVFNVCKVPQNFSGPWTQWRRFRTDDHDPKRAWNKQVQARRMRYEWFEHVSLSTGGRKFTLYVRSHPGEKPQGNCQPTTFGLSNTEHPFALPDVRVFK